MAVLACKWNVRRPCMAGRNIKNNADWFSHDADASSDEKVVYLESVFGHTGYAVYFKLLECMTRAEDFKLKWNDIKKAIYASKFGISVTEIDRFITECCRNEVEAFKIEDGYIYSPGLIKRLSPLLAKREYNRQKYQEQKQEVSNSETEKAISVTEMTQSKVKERKDIYPSNFLKFWNHYPKKIGKGAALKAYQTIKEPKPSLSTILQSIELHKTTEQWKTMRYIPNPATWLNQRRWEDEIQQPINGTTRKTSEQIHAELKEALS
jgi:hypothetical protein